MRAPGLFLRSGGMAALAAATIGLSAAPAAAQSAPAGAGPQAPSPSQPSASPADRAGPANPAAITGAPDDAAGTIVVTGFRRTIAAAAQLKRDAPQILDAIVAEDIGKLPDLAASDSLARVTGVQVERANGEAGRVLVRGLDLYTTTYNGRDIFTAEARRVAIQDFPAGGVQSLEVYKSTTADQIEGGVSGLINVRSFRPFDFKDAVTIAGEVRGTYGTQAQRFDPNGNILVSFRQTTPGGSEIGALVNFSYIELNYLDSARFVGGGISASTPAQSALPAFRYSDFVGINYGRGDRARPSVNGSLQWKPNDRLEFYFDALWQGFRRQRSDRQLGIPISRGGDGVFSNVQLIPGTDQAQSLTVAGQTRPELFQGGTYDFTDTYQFGIGGVWKSDDFRVAVDLARTDTKFDLSVYSFDTAFSSSPTVNVNYNVPRGDNGVEFSIPGFDLTNPANYIVRGFFDQRLVAVGNDYQARADASWTPQGLPLVQAIDFGFRFTDRYGGRTVDSRYSYVEPQRIPLSAAGLDLQVFHSGFRGSDIQQQRAWISPTYRTLRDNVGAIRALVGDAPGDPPFDPTNQFSANEKTYAGYGQLRYKLVTGIPIDGVVGLRVNNVQRSTRSLANMVDTDRTTFLPTANIRLNLKRDLAFRFSYTKTRTEPDFNQLAPNFVIPSTPGTSGRYEVSGGNPFLKPYDANNYDVIFEYYPSRTTFASVGLFKRDVANFIVNQTADVDFNGLPLRITGPVNLNQVNFEGVEAQMTAFLDYNWVPNWARGFGVQLNGTYINATNEGGTDRRSRIVGGVSDYSYNAIAIYERGPIAARLAWNWRSGYFDPGSNTDVRPIGRLDFTLNVTPYRNITVFAFGNNVLGQPFRNTYDYGGGVYPRDVRYEETIYGGGIRFRL